MAGIDKILLGGSTILSIEDEENRKEVEKLKNPEFSDMGNVPGITSFPDFLAKVKSKMDIFGFFRDFKAGMKFVLHAGQLVNNCTSDRTDLPLAAKQGKILEDENIEIRNELAKLNSDLGEIKYTSFNANVVDSSSDYYKKPLEFLKTKWNELDLNATYLIRIICGFSYLALVQKYNNHYYGTVFIISYEGRHPIYAQLNDKNWTENSIITNSDLSTKSDIFSPIFNGSSYSDVDSAVQACVDSLPSIDNTITYFRTVYKNSYYRTIIQKYSESGYASAIVFSYNLGVPRYYRKNNGIWQSPKDL